MDTQILLDEGYQFGLGVFETIAVERGSPVFLSGHLERMNRSADALEIGGRVGEEEVLTYLLKRQSVRGALKIILSGKNKIFTMRENPYQPEHFQKGFRLGYSDVLRNETSPLIFHKTLNYGDNILEKRRAAKEGMDEMIFCNTRGEICEGTCTNIFFAKEDKIYTPKVSCGLLPGILRKFLMERFPAEEAVLKAEDVEKMEECFVTNSLMGVMPVRAFGTKSFSKGGMTQRCRKEYLRVLKLRG